MARHRRSRHLGALTADQTANLMIGAGAVIGLGTLAYYFMREPAASSSGTTDLNEYYKKMTPEQRAATSVAMRQAAASISVNPVKAARDAYVASTATFTRSLYE